MESGLRKCGDDLRASETNSWRRLTAAMAPSERTLASPHPCGAQTKCRDLQRMNHGPWMALPICERVHILGLNQPDAQVIYAKWQGLLMIHTCRPTYFETQATRCHVCHQLAGFRMSMRKQSLHVWPQQPDRSPRPWLAGWLDVWPPNR